MSTLTDLLTQSKTILKYTGGCSTCPRKLVDFVPPTLTKSGIIAVGEAPGQQEVDNGEGFVGKSGQTLRSALKKAGIWPVAFTNAIHCRPPKNRDPTDREVSCCMNQHILGEIASYTTIILVGSVPMKAFFPGVGSRVRGNFTYHPDFPGKRFYGIYHPAAVGYDPAKRDIFEKQIGRLARILRGEAEIEFKIVQGEAFANGFEDFMRQASLLSYDLETTQLETWTRGFEITSFAACTVGSDVFTIDQGDPFWDEAQKITKSFCRDSSKQVLGQNIGFDLEALEHVLEFRSNLRYIHDLPALYYELEGRTWGNLKQYVADRLDGYRHLVPWPHLETDMTHLLPYNCEDVFHPLSLFLKDFPQLSGNTRDLYLTVTSPASLATRRIQATGVKIRRNAWQQLTDGIEIERLEAIKAWCAADPMFKPEKWITSKGFQKISDFLYKVKQYPVIERTKGGQPKTDEPVIKELIRQGHVELTHMLTLRGIDKRRSTYLKPVPGLMTEDGRVHSNYNYARTKAGRLSSNDPNMQNQPRGPLRRIFGVPSILDDPQLDPQNDCVWGSGDFAQIELRIAMCEANDPTGLDDFRSGRDPHNEMARTIVGRDPTYEERTKAKPVNFCLIYGGGPETLREYAANEYGIILTAAESHRWHGGFFERHPTLPDWHSSRRQQLRDSKGYMEGPTGHVWYYPNWDSDNEGLKAHDERSALNMTCQGPAAHLMNMLIYRVQQGFYANDIQRANGDSAEIILTVHDSLAWEVRRDHFDASVTQIGHELDRVAEWASRWFTVPLVLDMEQGRFWEDPDTVKV